MIPGSFMSGKVGLLSGREPRQGSYFYRKLEHLSPALHLDKIHPAEIKKKFKKKQRQVQKQLLECVGDTCVCACLAGSLMRILTHAHTVQGRHSSQWYTPLQVSLNCSFDSSSKTLSNF